MSRNKYLQRLLIKMNSLKIAILTDKVAPFFNGGYENRVYELASRLSKRNNVTIYTSLSHQSEYYNNCTYVRINSTSFQRYGTSQRNLFHGFQFALSLIFKNDELLDNDVIIIEAIPYIQLLVLSRWIKSSRALVVIDIMEAWKCYKYWRGIPGSIIARLIAYLLSKGIKFSNLVMSLSEVTKKSLMDNFSVSKQNILVVPGGINLSTINGFLMESDDQDNAEEFDIVSVSRLVSIKRLEDLIKAIHRVKMTLDRDVRVVIIGDGPQKVRLQKLIRDLSLERSISLLGFLPTDQKYRLIRKCRLFVLPSEREGFSLATLEAMACGVPVIVAKPRCAEVFGVSDFVKEDYNGAFYPVGNIDMLANVIKELLTNSNKLARYGENARISVENYDWNLITNNFENTLKILLSRYIKV